MKEKNHLFSATGIPSLFLIFGVLMLVILVFQFLPFWHYSTEGESFATSIQTYIWFPGECRDLDDYLAEQTGNEDIEAGQILGMPILVLVSGAVGIVLCLIKAKSAIVSLLPAICGISGIWGFLSTPAFQLGSNWVVSLVRDGVFAGVGGVVVFLPQILLIFLFLSILEDCGYMPMIGDSVDVDFDEYKKVKRIRSLL